jgi:co-chaperonin GroES (HSP10)
MLRPAHGRILVEPIKPPTQTSGGLAIPEAVQQSMQQPKGTILLLSDELQGKSHTAGLIVGAIVWYLPFAGATVVVDGPDGQPKLFLILKPEDIVAIEDTTPTTVTA